MATTIDNISPTQLYSVSDEIISLPVPFMIHGTPARKRYLKSRGGDTLAQIGYEALEPAITPLDNIGVDLKPQQPKKYNVFTKVQQYGTYVRLEELVTLQNQEDVLAILAERFAICLRESEDILARSVLESSASEIYCSAGVNNDRPTDLSRADVNDVVKLLALNSAHKFTDPIFGSPQYGTGPIRGSILALGSSELIGQLEDIDGFKYTSEYPVKSDADILQAEYGAISNMRFLLSPLGTVYENSSTLGMNVYGIHCTSPDAFSIVEQTGYTQELIYRPPAYVDPLGRSCEMGIRFSFGGGITNDLWVYKLLCTLRG